MAFNFNKAVQDDSKNGVGFKSSDFQKMFVDEAPSMGYISSKAPCEFILVPPHASYGASTTLTSGGFRQDSLRGVVPTLGQYGIDWVMVYRKIGNNPDPRKRKDVLAVNMIETEDGMTVNAEKDWGNGYKSPMYKLREYLWKCGGEHKYDKTQRRSVPTVAVDTSSARYKRAIELVPIDGNDLNAPLGRAARTMFLQGFLVNNAGISYTTDEEGNPSWPKHKILMINQVSAIKSREDARVKEGFYDAWFERTDGFAINPEQINEMYGDVSSSESAQLAWEQGFKHSDFGVNQKLVTFKSYPSGPAGIATYCCTAQNLSERMGANYKLPDEILRKVKPFSEYILNTNEQLQIQWLLELFPGDEWAFIEAGLISDGSNRVSMANSGYSPEVEQHQIPAPAAILAPAIPSRPTVMPSRPTAMPSMPGSKPTAMPSVPSMPSMPSMPKVPQSSAVPGSSPAAIPTAEDLSSKMKTLITKLHNNSNNNA